MLFDLLDGVFTASAEGSFPQNPTGFLLEEMSPPYLFLSARSSFSVPDDHFSDLVLRAAPTRPFSPRPDIARPPPITGQQALHPSFFRLWSISVSVLLSFLSPLTPLLLERIDGLPRSVTGGTRPCVSWDNPFPLVPPSGAGLSSTPSPPSCLVDVRPSIRPFPSVFSFSLVVDYSFARAPKDFRLFPAVGFSAPV